MRHFRIGSFRVARKVEASTKERSSDARGRLVGVGMAVANWHALLGHGEAWVRMTRDNILEVYAGVVDIGTGAKTQMAMIAAGVMGIPVERVRMIYGDTSVSPFYDSRGREHDDRLCRTSRSAKLRRS